MCRACPSGTNLMDLIKRESFWMCVLDCAAFIFLCSLVMVSSM